MGGISGRRCGTGKAPPVNRCLLVDDDTALLDAVAPYLGGFGFAVTAVETGAAMRQAVLTEDFDVVVLDVMLPDDNGLELCRWFRRTHATPLLMLTAQGDPFSRVVGLEMGADDFVPKPFEPRELVARMHAVLRRVSRGAPATVAAPASARGERFAGWSFDRLGRVLVSPTDEVVPLSNAEYRLLSVFADHAGQVLSRERLVTLTTAPGADVNARSVDLMVFRLRRKLSSGPTDRELIRTVRGSGYLFDGGAGP